MVPATTDGAPEEGVPDDELDRGDTPPSIASSWIDLIDDLGPVVFVDGVDAPGLDRRLAARGARRAESLGEATTVVLGARSRVDPSELPLDVTVAVLAANPWWAVRRPGIDRCDDVVAAAPLRRVRRRLPGATAFCLLPAAEHPSCALDLGAPAAARYALDALALHVGDGRRRAVLRLIRLAAGSDGVSTTAVAGGRRPVGPTAHWLI